MKKKRLIRRIVFTIGAFVTFVASVVTVMTANHELRLASWPLDPAGGGKVLLGLEQPEVHEMLDLYVVARRDSGRLSASEDSYLFRSPNTVRVGLNAYGYTSEADTEFCDVQRVRRPRAYRGALRCELYLYLYPNEQQRILVGGDISGAESGVRYELVGIPRSYLDTRSDYTVLAVFSLLAYFVGCWFVLREVRRLQKAATP